MGSKFIVCEIIIVNSILVCGLQSLETARGVGVEDESELDLLKSSVLHRSHKGSIWQCWQGIYLRLSLAVYCSRKLQISTALTKQKSQEPAHLQVCHQNKFISWSNCME